MSVFFVAPAEVELNEAVDYYDAQVPDLGRRFLGDVSAGIGRIVTHPAAWQEIAPDIRRYRLPHFPYGLIYSTLDNGDILVLAVAHLHRKPDYWRDRLKGTER